MLYICLRKASRNENARKTTYCSWYYHPGLKPGKDLLYTKKY